MQGIFISYRQSDSKAWASLLREELGDLFGHERIFLDRDTLGAGSWRQQIDAALAQCGVALVVIGPGWLDARGPDGQRRLDDPEDVHRHELSQLLRRPGLVVVPVLVDDTPMPAAAALPAELRDLAERQARPLSAQKARREVDLKALANDILRATGLRPLAATGTDAGEGVHHLPWRQDEAAARVAFQRWAKGRLMAPRDFATRAELEPLQRLWMPCWVAEGTMTALWRGRRGKQRTPVATAAAAPAAAESTPAPAPAPPAAPVIDWEPVEGDLRERFGPVVFPAVPAAAVARPLQLDAESLVQLVTASTLPVQASGAATLLPPNVDRTAAESELRERLDTKARDSARLGIGGDKSEVTQLDLRIEPLRLRTVWVPVYEGRCRYGGATHAVVIGGFDGSVEGDSPVSRGKLGLAAAGAAGVVALLVAAYYAFGR